MAALFKEVTPPEDRPKSIPPQYTKNIRITLIILGAILLILGFSSLFVKFNQITTLSNFSVEALTSFIPGIALLIIGYIFISLASHWGKLLHLFGKFFLQISAFALSITIVLFSFHSEVPDIVENIQPTIDTLLIETTQSEDNAQLQQILDLIEYAPEINVYRSKNLNQNEENFILEMHGLSDYEGDRSELANVIISSYEFNSLLFNTSSKKVLPYSQIKSEYDSNTQLATAMITNLLIIPESDTAELYVLTPNDQNQGLYVENLALLREECRVLGKDVNKVIEESFKAQEFAKNYPEYIENPSLLQQDLLTNIDLINEIPDSGTCDLPILTSFENLFLYLSNSEDLGLELPEKTLEEFSSRETIENNLLERTSLYSFSFLVFILLFLVSVALFNYDYIKSGVSEKSVERSLRNSFKYLGKEFLTPLIIITIVFILVMSGTIYSVFTALINTILLALETSLNLDISTLPIMLNFESIITRLFIIHIILASLFFIIYYFLKKYVGEPSA